MSCRILLCYFSKENEKGNWKGNIHLNNGRIETGYWWKRYWKWTLLLFWIRDINRKYVRRTRNVKKKSPRKGINKSRKCIIYSSTGAIATKNTIGRVKTLLVASVVVIVGAGNIVIVVVGIVLGKREAGTVSTELDAWTAEGTVATRVIVRRTKSKAIATVERSWRVVITEVILDIDVVGKRATVSLLATVIVGGTIRFTELATIAKCRVEALVVTT